MKNKNYRYKRFKAEGKPYWTILNEDKFIAIHFGQAIDVDSITNSNAFFENKDGAMKMVRHLNKIELIENYISL